MSREKNLVDKCFESFLWCKKGKKRFYFFLNKFEPLIAVTLSYCGEWAFYLQSTLFPVIVYYTMSFHTVPCHVHATVTSLTKTHVLFFSFFFLNKMIDKTTCSRWCRRPNKSSINRNTNVYLIKHCVFLVGMKISQDNWQVAWASPDEELNLKLTYWSNKLLWEHISCNQDRYNHCNVN